MKELEQFYEDTIYHYTTLIGAFGILSDNAIKFSRRSNSRDPIEHTLKTNSFSGLDIPTEILKEGSNQIRSRLDNLAQISFCTNSKSDEYKTYLVKPFDYFGFLKPRMWDQYADGYKGVCLAFSKQQLETGLSDEIIKDKVKYDKFSLLSQNNPSLCSSRLNEEGQSYLEEYIENFIEYSMMRKHLDYQMEDEYRFISKSSTVKSIEVKDALKGIIVSNKIPFEAIKSFRNIANENNIQYLTINWDIDGIRVKVW